MRQKNAYCWPMLLIVVLTFALVGSCTSFPILKPRPTPTLTPAPTPTPVGVGTGVTQFRVVITDQQLTDALSNDLSGVQETTISELQASIHSDGIAIRASVGAFNLRFHVMLQASVQLAGGRPMVEIQRIEFEGLPSHLNSIVTELLKNLLSPYLQQIPEPFTEGQITSIQLMEGQMIVEGYR